MDELRVIICEEERTTAYFTFSSQMRPSIHEFRIYGRKTVSILDQDHEILIKLRGESSRAMPTSSFLQSCLPSSTLRKSVRTTSSCSWQRDFHMDSGMKYLIESFYRSIREDAPVPIPYREILLTAQIMDAIFVAS